MAETYACLGQYEKALEKINEALKCNCDFWQYNIFKAEILYFLGAKDQALEILNKDIELAPGSAGSRYYHRALIYYDQGKYDLARDDLEDGCWKYLVACGDLSILECQIRRHEWG